MKRISVLLVAVSALVVVAAATGAPGPKLDKQDISAKQCAPDHSGARQLVDVHYKLINDSDSGYAGNYWANDTIDRHLKIWSETDGTYCVQVADNGGFVTYAGASPSGASTVAAGVKGHMEGGYITNAISGTFAPTRATHGDLGTFDLHCDQSGNCPGAYASWHDYFSSITASNDFAQWGWIYDAGKHGTWLNQDNGGAGDIT